MKWEFIFRGRVQKEYLSFQKKLDLNIVQISTVGFNKIWIILQYPNQIELVYFLFSDPRLDINKYRQSKGKKIY